MFDLHPLATSHGRAGARSTLLLSKAFWFRVYDVVMGGTSERIW